MQLSMPAWSTCSEHSDPGGTSQGMRWSLAALASSLLALSAARTLTETLPTQNQRCHSKSPAARFKQWHVQLRQDALVGLWCTYRLVGLVLLDGPHV